MFTGIILAQSKIVSRTKSKSGVRVTVARPRGWKVTKGQSISINGVCSTVASFDGRTFVVDYMPETLTKTNAATLMADSMVNLEPSLRLGDEVGGHFVTGHVDGVGVVTKVEKQGRSKVLHFTITKSMAPLVAAKGSITLDGVSLTVVSCRQTRCSVSLVDYTLNHTSLGQLKVGDQINIELDIIAKYLQKIITHNATKK